MLLSLVVALAPTAMVSPPAEAASGTSASPAASQAPARPTVVAYIPYWDQQRGFDVALANADVITDVSPWWYSVGADGQVALQWDGATHVDRAAVRRLQERGVKVLPVVSNHRDGVWDIATVQQVLHDPVKRDRHVASIVELVVSHGYDGIDIDYEDLQARDRQVFSEFLAQLGDALRAHDRTLAVDVFAKSSDAGYDERNLAQDYAAIGAAADQVRLMAYDWHWSTSTAGPVAPLWWVDEVITWTVTQVPRHKVVMGMALFGYDWVGNRGEPLTWEDVHQRERTFDAATRWDGASSSPTYTYTDAEGRFHEVWFENAYSVGDKLRLVDTHGIAGVHFWRLGGEDPDVWQRVRTQLPSTAPEDAVQEAPAPPADTTAPAVTITSPRPGSRVARGARVEVRTAVTDGTGVDRVEIRVDGRLRCTDTTAPYTCTFRASSRRRATHTVEATAVDAAGNTSSDTVRLTTR